VARAERTDMKDVLAHGFEDGPRTRKRLIVPAAHENERRGTRAFFRAGYGRIDHLDLPRRKLVRNLARDPRLGG
jgi:hypothetical protein